MSYPTITGVGLAVPERLITNTDFTEITGLDTDDRAIRRLTGIERRYWVEGADNHATILGTIAAREALTMASVPAQTIDSIYLSTASPDHPSPSVASMIHGNLQASENCGALDINAACAGGVFALRQGAAEMIAFGTQRTLAIGSEIMSPGLDRSDRKSAILFGDGAGAAVLEQQADANKPYFATMTRPDLGAIYVPPAGHAQKDPSEASTIRMNGKEVAKHAAYVMPTLAFAVAGQADLLKSATEIDWQGIDYFVPHQANKRMLEPLNDGLQVPDEKRVYTVEEFGNTSSASVLMALRAAYDRGTIQPGRKRVLFTSVGAGIVGAAGLIDINLPPK